MQRPVNNENTRVNRATTKAQIALCREAPATSVCILWYMLLLWARDKRHIKIKINIRSSKVYSSQQWSEYLAVKTKYAKKNSTPLRMLRWAMRMDKIEKAYVKNEDIWREANIEPMITCLG